jgi:hypothetical protein
MNLKNFSTSFLFSISPVYAHNAPHINTTQKHTQEEVTNRLPLQPRAPVSAADDRGTACIRRWPSSKFLICHAHCCSFLAWSSSPAPRSWTRPTAAYGILRARELRPDARHLPSGPLVMALDLYLYPRHAAVPNGLLHLLPFCGFFLVDGRIGRVAGSQG